MPVTFFIDFMINKGVFLFGTSYYCTQKTREMESFFHNQHPGDLNLRTSDRGLRLCL